MGCTFISKKIDGVYVIEPRVFEDARGHFFESYNAEDFKEFGLEYNWVQDNQSFSEYGTIRGLHFQKGKFAQAKLVRVLVGEVMDIAVDLRPDSKTYGKFVSAVLSSENKRQLLIPRGFAHGFSVLSETAVFAYKCDNIYNKESEGGIRWNCPEIGIDWGVPAKNQKLSQRDKLLPLFAEFDGGR